jgi:hypothetical protein
VTAIAFVIAGAVSFYLGLRGLDVERRRWTDHLTTWAPARSASG